MTPAELWSCEAEQAVLGCLLIDGDAWDRTADLVSEADFFDRRHGEVFLAVGRQINAGKPADVVTVFEALEAAGKAEECGGLSYLNEMAQSIISSAHARRYAEIVRTHSLRRGVLRSADQATEIARTESDPRIAVDRIGALFDAVELGRSDREARAIGDLAVERTGHYEALASNEVRPGISTGLPMFDRALGGGLKPGRLIVVGARPSVGKTALAIQLGVAVAAAGHGTLVFELEMPAEDLTDRVVAADAGISLSRIATGELTDNDWNLLSQAVDRLGRLPLRIDDQPGLSLQQIRSKARQHRRRHGLALIVIDYLQLMAVADGKLHRHHQIEQISRGMKQLAKELAVTVVLLSQLTRASADREPELSDLKESGAIEEDADVVAMLHPMGNEPDGSQLLLLKLAKNRQGRRGRLALAFDGRYQRLAESSSNVDRRTGSHQ
jgi:replicative DNA helicase